MSSRSNIGSVRVDTWPTMQDGRPGQLLRGACALCEWRGPVYFTERTDTAKQTPAGDRASRDALRHLKLLHPGIPLHPAKR